MAKRTTFASLFGDDSIKDLHYSFFDRFAFDTFDANHDGTIDFEEFLLAISATSQGDLDDRLAVAFDM